MRGEDLKLFAAIIQKAAYGRTCALATIVGTKGSTPRKVGTKMLVDPAEGLLGVDGRSPSVSCDCPHQPDQKRDEHAQSGGPAPANGTHART